jgi:hypothetical protein
MSRPSCTVACRETEQGLREKLVPVESRPDERAVPESLVFTACHGVRAPRRGGARIVEIRRGSATGSATTATLAATATT